LRAAARTPEIGWPTVGQARELHDAFRDLDGEIVPFRHG
jgi:hypothetical protein